MNYKIIYLNKYFSTDILCRERRNIVSGIINKLNTPVFLKAV